MDFTLVPYITLLKALIKQGFSFQTFSEYFEKPNQRVVILRNDIDSLPENVFKIANIQNKLGITGTYFIRTKPGLFSVQMIRELNALGHEVGYHYEDMHLVAKGNRDEKTKSWRAEEELVGYAIESFQKNLGKLRRSVQVRTICMHGSPISRWDSRMLWKYYDYRDFGIEAEPYFDINFSNTLYLTDTGRRWNGGSVSVRDKWSGNSEQLRANSEKLSVTGEEEGGYYADWKVKPVRGSLMRMTQEGFEFQSRYVYRSTNDIIRAVEDGSFPDKAMITFHPQRWTDRSIPWLKELVFQNLKNAGKYFLIKVRRE